MKRVTQKGGELMVNSRLDRTDGVRLVLVIETKAKRESGTENAPV
ncbi:MAG: hypothetical protein PUG70_05700 [Lachnospiraceae bacterium]|nr:hypothetical protein [Lachnospiraceae bacterium]MDY5520753.1 hypothetical protein [Agathobacter sp.]